MTQSRHVPIRLRPVNDHDLQSLRDYEFMVLGSRWRSRGFTSSSDEFAARLFNGPAQQVIGESDLGPHCWLQAYNFDFAARHCEIALARLDLSSIDPRPTLRCFVAFVDEIFRSWNISKCYIEVPEYNFDRVTSLVGDTLAIEGRRLDYVYLEGRSWDLVIAAITLEAWSQSSQFNRYRDGGGTFDIARGSRQSHA